MWSVIPLETLKTEITVLYPDISDDLMVEACELVHAKMCLYERIGIKKECDYIFFLIPDVLRAVIFQDCSLFNCMTKIMNA